MYTKQLLIREQARCSRGIQKQRLNQPLTVSVPCIGRFVAGQFLLRKADLHLQMRRCLCADLRRTPEPHPVIADIEEIRTLGIAESVEKNIASRFDCRGKI